MSIYPIYPQNLHTWLCLIIDADAFYANLKAQKYTIWLPKSASGRLSFLWINFLTFQFHKQLQVI